MLLADPPLNRVGLLGSSQIARVLLLLKLAALERFLVFPVLLVGDPHLLWIPVLEFLGVSAASELEPGVAIPRHRVVAEALLLSGQHLVVPAVAIHDEISTC